MERVGFVSRLLLFVEPVVLDEGLRTVPVHEAIVLLGAVSRIGDGRFRKLTVSLGKTFLRKV